MELKEKMETRKEQLRGNYASVRCPKGCGRILFEVSARHLEPGSLEARCPACSRAISPAMIMQTEGESHALSLVYHCVSCGVSYTREAEGIREKCSKCHHYENVFLLGSLSPLSSVPAQKLSA